MTLQLRWPSFPRTVLRHSHFMTLANGRWAHSSFAIRTSKHPTFPTRLCRSHHRSNVTSSSFSPLAGAASGDHNCEGAENGDERTSDGGNFKMSGTTTAVVVGLWACALLFPQASSSAEAFPSVMTFAGVEPSNALSLPTWVIHVASVAEWVTAMALVWKYGDTKGNSAWKGLTWGMVPLLGGAMCACSWHFFYNAESLEVLVVLQAFLTVAGNFTMWAAAYRIWKLSKTKATVD